MVKVLFGRGWGYGELSTRHLYLVKFKFNVVMMMISFFGSMCNGGRGAELKKP